jgi:PAS domain S-box-containing protein
MTIVDLLGLRTVGLLAPGRNAGQIPSALSSFTLICLVFYLDTFTNAGSGIALLYGLGLLLASDVLSGFGIFLAAALCVILTAISLGVSGDALSSQGNLRAVISFAAIATTAAVLIKRRTSTEHLERTNDALQRSETRFRAIFEQSRVALWEQDFSKLKAMLVQLRDGGVSNLRRHSASSPSFLQECAGLIESVSVNDATGELLGRKSEEISGSISKFIPRDEECLLGIVECLFSGRTRFEGKGKIVRPDGTTLSVLLVLSFPEDGIGLDRVVVGMFDVTERDRAQQALLAAQAEMAKVSRVAMVGALSASLAHELNQPVGAVVLNAQSCVRWLRRASPDIPSASDAAERIVRDAHRVAGILKSTREMIMRNPVRPEVTDVGKLIGETCLLLEHELTSGSIVLQTRIPSHMPKVTLAKAEIQQVLVNLLNNGIQSINSGGGSEKKVSIECSMSGDGAVVISVRDFGRGIEENALQKLFDPFFTTKESGMGIGLSICRAMVEAQGGKLSGRNHDGGGAVFQVSLPAEAIHD